MLPVKFPREEQQQDCKHAIYIHRGGAISIDRHPPPPQRTSCAGRRRNEYICERVSRQVAGIFYANLLHRVLPIY